MQRFVQLAFDLFGDDPPEAPRAPPAPGPAPAAAAAPALPMAEVFQPGTWHHPRANRLVRLRGCEVGYEFQRGKRRTIGLSVGTEGLSVRAPRWSTFGEIEAVLQEKAGWVIDKLIEARERAERQARNRIAWADGVALPLLGEPVRLQLDPAHGFSGRGAALDSATRTLRVGLPRHASESQIRDAAQAWLMRHARSVFTERLNHFAPRLGVQWTRLSLSNADTRWGSASADGRIRLNWRLIHLSLDMVDYVVVHELSHLRHMDHSPRFWDVVASVMPDHLERRRALKASALPLGED
ncbi:M48 family metallopeptidase [Hydrogenophaga sp. T2]|uniref:M48 family metallopeptidase n=1 Tax=Hydrogenophaga sp. T2 TaxID=3132823 RepID=UPI003CE8CDB1